MTHIQAAPRAEQAAHFSRLAQIASDDLFSLLFGARAEAVLASMFLRRDNDNSHAYTTFLLAGDAIAGMLHAYPAADARRHAARSVWLYLRFAAWQLPRALALGFVLRDILDFVGGNLEADDFYIAMLAIYPAFRGCGHSKRLLKAAEGRAAASGCARLTLDVDERNHIARAAYRSAGFQQVARSKAVELGGERFAVLRLAKPLAPIPQPMAPAK